MSIHNHLILHHPLLLLPSTFRSLILCHLDVGASRTSSEIEDRVPCFVATASALPDVRALVPGSCACPFASLCLPLVWKLREGGAHVPYILSTPGSRECPVTCCCRIPRSVSGGPLKSWSGFSTWSWGTRESRTTGCWSAARTSYATVSRPVRAPPPFICAADSSSVSFSMRLSHSRGVPGGSAVKNLPAVQETQEMRAQSLGREDPLEEGMATHSSTLAWRIPWTEEPGGLQSMGSQTIRHDRSDLAYADLIVKLAVKFFMDEKPGWKIVVLRLWRWFL